MELLAQKLAKFHSLEIPIPKDSVEQNNDLYFTKWFNEDLIKCFREGVIRHEIEKHKYTNLCKINLTDELQWVRKTMEQINSPIVFSHNDLNRRNILIKEDNESKETQIFFIDFDWTNYYYRGIDLGQYFALWGQKEVDFGYVDFPSDQQMCVFIDAYINEMTKIFGTSYGKEEISCRQQLIKEAKVFALFSYIKDIQYLFWLTSYTENKESIVRKVFQLLTFLQHFIIYLNIRLRQRKGCYVIFDSNQEFLKNTLIYDIV